MAEPGADGANRILVAVADVDALVHAGSALDAHARANTTSVYTAGQVFPMFPEKLSTDLTSLGEGQDRLAIVVELTVGPDGVVRGSAGLDVGDRVRVELLHTDVKRGFIDFGRIQGAP